MDDVVTLDGSNMTIVACDDDEAGHTGTKNIPKGILKFQRMSLSVRSPNNNGGESSLRRKVEDLVRCVVCLEVPRGPILQCHSGEGGHITCDVCDREADILFLKHACRLQPSQTVIQPCMWFLHDGRG